MADRIKGITIEIGGDTTQLSKALSGINKEISSTQSQLKDVERLLKMDPGNITLLEQKQRLLGDAIDKTKQKLSALKDAEKQVQAQFAKGEASQKQVDALTREIVAQTTELEKLETKLKTTNNQLSKFSHTAANISSGAGKISKAFKPVTTAVAGVGAAIVSTIPATQELRSDLSKLDTNAKEHAVSIEAVRDAWRDLAVQSGETDSAVEAVSNLLQAGFTESNLQKAVEGLAGAAQRFPDTLKIESLADSLQETLATSKATGQFGELLDRLGIGADNFSEKLEKAGSEAAKQNLILETLADAGLNKTYQAWQKNNEEMIANQEANLNFQESLSSLAEEALPIVTKVTDAMASLIQWFSDLNPSIQAGIVGFALFLAAVSPVSGAISKISSLIGLLSTNVIPALKTALPAIGGAISSIVSGISGAFSSIFTFITGTVVPGITGALSSLFAFIVANPIVAVIAAIIAAIVGLVVLITTKGDEIKAILQSVDDFLQGVFATDWTEVFGPILGEALNSFFATVKNIWDSIKQIFEGIIDFVQGVFTGNWEQAWSGVVDIFEGLFNGLVAIVKAPINGIIGLINGVISALNTMIDGLNSIKINIPSWVPGLGGKSLGFNIPKIGTIPYLAKGGILSQGSAVVGEAGPELLTLSGGRAIVQPLTNHTKSQYTNLGGVNINVYGNNGQDVNQLANIVMDKIESAYQSKGAVFGVT